MIGSAYSLSSIRRLAVLAMAGQPKPKLGRMQSKVADESKTCGESGAPAEYLDFLVGRCRNRREIPIDLETFSLALFRVKLRRETATAAYCRRERTTIIALG